MKKIIWVDVGTHFAQEHSSIFGSNINFFFFVLKRFIGGVLLNRGRFVNFEELKIILKSRYSIRKQANKFFSIFVEANKEIVREKKFYPDADLIFNIALTEEKSKQVAIAKLYLGKGDILGEGSSLFENKHGKSDQSYLATLGVSSKVFFEEIREYLDNKFGDYDVLLRLNCEGVEDEVIFSAHQQLSNKLKLICGSLKDVEELKGKQAAEDLDSYMENNGLPFVKFSSGIYSWYEAHSMILSLVKDDEN